MSTTKIQKRDGYEGFEKVGTKELSSGTTTMQKDGVTRTQKMGGVLNHTQTI